jgi:wyosine [tRNA(Phe)-imidazoG37] synthetase (radical SAM superfamily)
MPKDGEVAGRDREGRDKPAISVGRHPRIYRENLYVYPVLSRRARGISIGVNLNPDKVCNFDCIYCQVDRTTPPAVRRVDEARLKEELSAILHEARSGSLFERPEFRALPDAVRVVRDITFAGDGEPPSYPHFKRVVEDVLSIKRIAGFDDLKVILLTNATLIDRPQVREAMQLMDRDHGEFWLKLDAGTEEYYRLVDRTTIPLVRVLANILEAARIRPVVLQSLFMRVRGAGPPPEEIGAYCDRVRQILAGGGAISLIQVYTVARAPAETYVTPLTDDELDEIASRVRERVPDVRVETFYSGTLD